MPELPDLQVFARNLDKKLSDKTLKAVTVLPAAKLNVTHNALQDKLHGQKLEKVYRSGKELYFKFSKGDVLAMHLMLHGKLYLFEKENEQKYSLIELLFTDGTGLVLTDFQKAAKPTLNPADNHVPDAGELNIDYLKEKLSKKKTSVKTVLLDQKLIRGIGNAYADEILWDARISPFSIANKIPGDKVKDLLKSIEKVLKDAEQQIIKSNPEIIAGEVRDFMLIHNAKKKQSPTGKEILVEKDSRKTYYTEEQVLYD